MIQMTSKNYTQDNLETLGVVYIVEDDEAVRDSLKWLLEASSYRVELFDSGEMFLAKFDPNAIAVLVLDVRMPGMSGLEVQEHLIARKCDIPIIFISGHGDVSMAVSTLKKGAVDFIENLSTRLLCVLRLKECSRKPDRDASEQNAALLTMPC